MNHVSTIRRALAVTASASLLTGCASSIVHRVPYEAPPSSAGKSTFVVYRRGGMFNEEDNLVVLDGKTVVGAVGRNQWMYFQAPPGEHELMLVVPFDPTSKSDPEFMARRCGDEKSPWCDEYRAKWKEEQAKGRRVQCYRAVLKTEESRRYFARLRYVAPAASQTATGESVRGRVDDMKRDAAAVQANQKARENTAMAPTAAEQQLAAQQAMQASAADLGVGLAGLASDPEAPPGTIGYRFDIVRDPKELGARGVTRLDEWERVELDRPADAQALYDRLKPKARFDCQPYEGGPLQGAHLD